MSERTEGEQERAKCPACGAERIGCNMGTWGDAYECGSYSGGHRSDTCRIRERDAAISTIRTALSLPPDTPPAKVAEEVGRVIGSLPRTKDGVPIVPGMTVWTRYWAGPVQETVQSLIVQCVPDGSIWMAGEADVDRLYSTAEAARSTPAAAEAARGEGAESKQERSEP